MQPNAYEHNTLQNSTSSQETVLRKSYALLGFSFLPAAAGAMTALSTNMSLFRMFGNQWIVIGIFFAFFYGMCFLIEKNRYSNVGVALLMAFTFGMGYMAGPLLAYSMAFSNGPQLIAISAIMTAAVFLTMAALARTSAIQTSTLARFVTIGVVVAMIAMIASLFMSIPALSLTVSALFVAVSSALIMLQVRNVIEGGEDSHISAALTLFIAVYNIFTGLLRILLAFAGEE